MPTYEYTCQKCDHQFEVYQPITDDPLKVCPKEHCKMKRWGRGALKRAVGGGAGLIFKGSGFYITDYRSDNYKQSAKNEASAAQPKTESKPEPKSGASKPDAGKSSSGSSEAA